MAQKLKYIPYLFLIALTLLMVGYTGSSKPSVGMWSECQNYNATLNHPDRLKAMIADAQGAGVDEIFLQVFRSGQAWYPSRVAEQFPGVKEGFDPLRFAIDQAHAKGIKVHAWVNCFNFALNNRADIFRRYGYRVLAEDNMGRKSMSYLSGVRKLKILSEGPQPEFFYEKAPDAYLDTPGLWLDPGDETVQRYLLVVILEMIRKYPDLDGVHLDYVRYPYVNPIRVRLDFGYNEASRILFKNEEGLDAPYKNTGLQNGDEFDEWRRTRLTLFVKRARTLLRRENSHIKLSAAVMGQEERAYSRSFQDWRGWLKSGIVDFAVIMNYTRSPDISEDTSRRSVSFRGQNSGVYIGLGAYMVLDNPENLKAQIKAAADAGADGIVFFSYDNMLKRPEVFNILRDAL